MAKHGYGTGHLYEKHGNWYGRWRDANGRQFNRKIGSMDDLNRKQATRALQAMIDGEDAPAYVSDRDDTCEALGAAMVRWLEGRGRKQSHTKKVAEHLRVHIVPFFGDQPIARIDDDDVEEFMAALSRKRCSRGSGRLAAKTRRNIHGTLHTLFVYAQKKKKVGRNPVALVEPPPLEVNADIRFLTLDELGAVVRQIEPGPWEAWDRAIFTTAPRTGMRMGELLGWRWIDVDWLGQKGRIRRAWLDGEFTTPKSKRSSRSVPLVADVLRALDQLHKATAYGADEDLVFCNPVTGEPPARSTVSLRFKPLLKAAGVRDVRFHDLRHTFGTLMASKGTPMRALQELMGHRDLNTTLIYADYAPSGQELEWAEAAFTAQGTFGEQSGPSYDQVGPADVAC